MLPSCPQSRHTTRRLPRPRFQGRNKSVVNSPRTHSSLGLGWVFFPLLYRELCFWQRVSSCPLHDLKVTDRSPREAGSTTPPSPACRAQLPPSPLQKKPYAQLVVVSAAVCFLWKGFLLHVRGHVCVYMLGRGRGKSEMPWKRGVASPAATAPSSAPRVSATLPKRQRSCLLQTGRKPPRALPPPSATNLWLPRTQYGPA